MSEARHSQLIRGRELVADEWGIVPLADGSTQGSADGVSPAPTDTNGNFFLLPLPIWLATRQELLVKKAASGNLLGVWLSPSDDPAILAEDIGLLDLIAVNFPKFVDGRGYSTATLLRQRYGYRGELRAIGDIGRDQLFYLARVGFDSFLISDGRDAAAALASLSDFPEVYQTACDQAVPLFRRREIQAAA